MAAEAGYKLFTYGSFRLGVHSPGSDIDTLCVAPRNVTRQDFFVDLKEMLEKDPDITELSVSNFFNLTENSETCYYIGISVEYSSLRKLNPNNYVIYLL